MIGKIVSTYAGRSVARNLGGNAAGPVGAMIGAAIPIVIAGATRRLGPVGMIATAVGSVALGKYLKRRAEREEALQASNTELREALAEKRGQARKPPLPNMPV